MKRFYQAATITPAAPGWRVTLDDRPIRTPAGRPQHVPTRALAQAMAAEWTAQGETINPAAFPLRDLADTAIDIVAPDRPRTIGEILAYAETDTLLYRADPDEPLHARQREVWEPLLQAAENRYAVAFKRVSGIIHAPQPAATLARLERELETRPDFPLAALRHLASLATSLTIALAALTPTADAQTLWNAANLEEDWQADLWGHDPEATAHRTRRLEAFKSAMRFAKLATTP